jgi:hypothetical protein
LTLADNASSKGVAMRRPSPSLVISLVALGVAASGTAYAATGGTFILGRANTAGAVSSLKNSAGTALSLTSKAGTPPLAVGNTVQVPNLNASEVGGKTAADLGAARVWPSPVVRLSATRTAVCDGAEHSWGGGVLAFSFVLPKQSHLLFHVDASGYASSVNTGQYVVQFTNSPVLGVGLQDFISYNTAVEHHSWSATAEDPAFLYPAGTYHVDLDVICSPASGSPSTISADQNDTADILITQVA